MTGRGAGLSDVLAANELWAVVSDLFAATNLLMYRSGFMMLASLVIAVLSARFIWKFVKGLS